MDQKPNNPEEGDNQACAAVQKCADGTWNPLCEILFRVTRLPGKRGEWTRACRVACPSSISCDVIFSKALPPGMRQSRPERAALPR
jgi:hypothetical protein